MVRVKILQPFHYQYLGLLARPIPEVLVAGGLLLTMVALFNLLLKILPTAAAPMAHNNLVLQQPQSWAVPVVIDLYHQWWDLVNAKILVLIR